MLVVKILAVIFGLAFTLFGYFIFFKKKYTLINDFDEDWIAGRKDENYAKRIGIVEFIVGIALLVVAVILFVFA